MELQELDFLRDCLKKCRLQTQLVEPAHLSDWEEQLGLRKLLEEDEEYRLVVQRFVKAAAPRTVYRFTDRLRCAWIFLRLDEERLFLVGPYATFEPTRELLMELAEGLGIAPDRYRTFQQHFERVPHLPNNSPVFAMLAVLYERLWGTDYTDVDINRAISDADHPFPVGDLSQAMEDPQLSMRLMEQRYAYENEMIQAVRLGLSHKAEQILATMSTLSFERRTADPVRNLKNYCVIMNTLLRKAAEDGGVHPLYLDRVSSDFAHRVEAVTSTQALEKLMREMFRSYCRLVKKNSIKHYSPPIQRAIVQIDSDLSGDLSLKRLALLQNINASYLSTLFKRETGQTVTDFVNQRRIQLARQLLTTTKLQIQTIARYCGIPDVNYFSKIFKKHTGHTPKEYRQSVLAQMPKRGE